VLVPDPAIDRLVAVDGAVEALPADAPLLTLVAGRPDPMDVRLEQPSSMVARLPERDRQWLADGGFQLLVPMPGAGGVLVGLIAIGAKRSELPFSGEDRWLLSAIASSGALAIENLQLRTPDVPALSPSGRGSAPLVFGSSDVPASECASCGLVLPPQTSSCPTCGGQIRQALLPMVVRGTFRIDRLLGRGGMGVVYRAFDVPLGRVVAVKTLPAVSPERAQQIRREAKAMAAVAHPKLATIFAIELWRGTPMLIVEYFDSTLYDRLRRGPLAPAEAVRVIGELAEGLEALHSAGILHRDVKPSNIGLTAGTSAKLLDFGLAKVVRHTRVAIVSDQDALQSTATAQPAWAAEPADPVSAPHQMIGTTLYMSPETLLLRPPDASVDLWSLALVLYESLAGVHPMRAATVIETVNRIASARVPDIREHWPDCPSGLAAFLEQALHADRRKRPGTAREFRLGLERTCADVLTG
jgi:serine/threonine protein kinase